jgi:hypothetical protein
MIHNVPTQGLFMHGLVNYNPKFFWMLARSNGYKWLHMCSSLTRSGCPALATNRSTFNAHRSVLSSLRSILFGRQ